MEKEKIKIGILISNYVTDLWKYKIIKKLINKDFAEIKLIIIGSDEEELVKKIKYSLVYRFHEKLDYFFFRKRINYNSKIDISELVLGVPQIYYEKIIAENGSDNNIKENVPDLVLDLILNLGVELPKSNLINEPKYGIWTYKIGDPKVTKALPSGYWEMMHFYELGSYVSMIHGGSPEVIIYRTWVSTYPTSVGQIRDQIFNLAPLAISRIINGLFSYGDSYLEDLIDKYSLQDESYALEKYDPPSSFTAAKNLLSIVIKYFGRKIVFMNPDPWHIIYKLNVSDIPFDIDINSFSQLRAPKGWFWADPFVIRKDGSYFLFIEEYNYKTTKGHISVLELNDKGSLINVEKVIEKPYHMSYPFIFLWENSYYMIPETMEDKTIQLYKCSYFPNKWEFVMNLMENISSADTTLFYYGNRWWLFTAIDETDTNSHTFTELFLYYSDNLFTDKWLRHPKNPIVSDLKNSRPAGKIFEYDGKIYRPSQDCSGRYGRGLNINQITVLNEYEYSETLVTKIDTSSSKKLLGTHTLNFDKGITALDANLIETQININPLKKRKGGIDLSRYVKVTEQKGNGIRILFFIDGLVQGGKERRLIELMKGLKRVPEVSFELVLMNETIHYKEVFDLGIKIHFVLRRTRRDISVFRKFYVICKNNKPDIVHCWDSMTATYLVPACSLLKLKIVNGMVVDTPVIQNISNKNWLRARVTFPFAKIIIGNSKAGLSAYRAPDSKSICIYNGMDLTRFVNLKDPEEVLEEIFGKKSADFFIVGMVAAFEARKDYNTLIEAANILVSSYDDIRFVMVGSGTDLDRIKSKVLPSQVDKLIFLGIRSDIESYVNIFDVGVLLTNSKVHGEGISNSIIEYMALGRPVIATRGGGTDEVVINNKNGYLIDFGNVNQLIDRITAIYKDRKLIKELGKEGRNMVLEKFDIKIMADRYLSVYRELFSWQ